jgi:hypothetical protein
VYVAEFVVNVQARVIVIISLLLLAIGATICAAKATVGAIQNVHQHEIMKKNEDVNLIGPWMTIPYIAHVYRVPERTLYQPLQLQSNPSVRHSTLQIIAAYKKQPVEKVIHKVQSTIIIYRRSHPVRPAKPPPTPTNQIQKGEFQVH